ncbi:patatin-like phospholipase family protein [Desulfovibrio inopinatus]|uniref:patatin-like phospholipase family protein n=1 Tax=Desulfovibrio inopinatus TaxID=102109 RepID=UPI0003FEB9F9|nr:patatin-like phospholipase family protein [Desulfovibrio inopinatus]
MSTKEYSASAECNTLSDGYRFLCICVIVVFTLIAGGCGALRVRKPVPEDKIALAEVKGFPHVRGFADELSPALLEGLVGYARQRVEEHKNSNGEKPINYLAISGGGPNGAFGAGLLCGWSVAGSRPVFDIVTGVSTGAFIAPFAFLGADYDDELKEVYTTISSNEIYVFKGIMSILRGDSVFDTAPLDTLVKQYITKEMMDAVAREYRVGRRLYIGTTNLDAKRSVVWDMGAIASQGTSEALKLFQDVLIGSSAIPVAFPPMYFKVEADGKTWDEMHVDGGVTTQIFLYGPHVNPRKIYTSLHLPLPDSPRHLYVLVNNRMGATYDPVSPRLLSIAADAVSSLIKAQTMGAIYTMYNLSRDDDVDFNLACIPESFTLDTGEDFDPQIMKELFQLGYDLALTDKLWSKTPPDYSSQ